MRDILRLIAIAVLAIGLSSCAHHADNLASADEAQPRRRNWFQNTMQWIGNHQGGGGTSAGQDMRDALYPSRPAQNCIATPWMGGYSVRCQ